MHSRNKHNLCMIVLNKLFVLFLSNLRNSMFIMYAFNGIVSASMLCVLFVCSDAVHGVT